ncbi:hypothetical protein ISN44_As10g008940 [Arabidopsis suecica]|uniref:Uncharacterized protein n=1 Tax=Arabidopsis suecica TaxID=45249 RepID=A0A8T1ZVG9_ARASU|nr:hypothetical protein ISN44_As10g008940 [Arabidopsis suecica]
MGDLPGSDCRNCVRDRPSDKSGPMGPREDVGRPTSKNGRGVTSGIRAKPMRVRSQEGSHHRGVGNKSLKPPGRSGPAVGQERPMGPREDMGPTGRDGRGVRSGIRDESRRGYAIDGNKCLIWTKDVLNLHQLDANKSEGSTFYLRVAASNISSQTSNEGKNFGRRKLPQLSTVVAIVVSSTVAGATISVGLYLYLSSRRRNRRAQRGKHKQRRINEKSKVEEVFFFQSSYPRLKFVRRCLKQQLGDRTWIPRFYWHRVDADSRHPLSISSTCCHQWRSPGKNNQSGKLRHT